MRKLVECGLFDASDQQATSTTINGTDTTKILPESLVTSIASTLEGGLESLDEYENDYDPDEAEKDRSTSWLHTLVKCVLPLARLVGGGIFSSIVLIGAGLYVVALVSLLLIPVAATGYFLAYMLLGLPIMFLFLDRMHALHKMKFPAHWGFVRTISYLIMAGKYLVDTHFPAFVSFFAQGGITWVLWYSLPSFEGSEFCPQSESNYFYLEIALLGLFYAAMIASFNDIFLEMRLIGAKRIAITRGETTLLIRIPFSYTIYARLLLVVMMELTVWVGVAIVGTKYILTAGQPSDLIQAAVAINFINDIDNCFYDSYVPEKLKAGVEEMQLEYLAETEFTQSGTFDLKLLRETLSTLSGQLSLLSFLGPFLGGPYMALVPILIVLVRVRQEFCE